MAKNFKTVGLEFLDSAPYRQVHAITIARPPAAVFAALAQDPAGWGAWFPGFGTDGAYLTPPPHGVGSQREMTVRGSKILETVLVWDEPTRWAFYIVRASMPGVRALAEDYVLQPQGEGTLLTWTFALDIAPAARPIAAVMGKMSGSMMRKAVGNLEKVGAQSTEP